MDSLKNQCSLFLYDIYNIYLLEMELKIKAYGLGPTMVVKYIQILVLMLSTTKKREKEREEIGRAHV